MKDYNKENEIRILEEIKTFCESMISLNSTDKRSEKIEAFFEEMKKRVLQMKTSMKQMKTNT